VAPALVNTSHFVSSLSVLVIHSFSDSIEDWNMSAPRTPVAWQQREKNFNQNSVGENSGYNSSRHSELITYSN
jgi:hypothetical protein